MYEQLMLTRIGELEYNCGYCDKENPIFMCAACHIIRYCNDTCSKKDWARHKSVCGSFKIIAETPIILKTQ